MHLNGIIKVFEFFSQFRRFNFNRKMSSVVRKSSRARTPSASTTAAAAAKPKRKPVTKKAAAATTKPGKKIVGCCWLFCFNKSITILTTTSCEIGNEEESCCWYSWCQRWRITDHRSTSGCDRCHYQNVEKSETRFVLFVTQF